MFLYLKTNNYYILLMQKMKSNVRTVSGRNLHAPKYRNVPKQVRHSVNGRFHGVCRYRNSSPACWVDCPYGGIPGNSGHNSSPCPQFQHRPVARTCNYYGVRTIDRRSWSGFGHPAYSMPETRTRPVPERPKRSEISAWLKYSALVNISNRPRHEDMPVRFPPVDVQNTPIEGYVDFPVHVSAPHGGNGRSARPRTAGGRLARTALPYTQSYAIPAQYFGEFDVNALRKEGIMLNFRPNFA